jgi:hypothetical protein
MNWQVTRVCKGNNALHAVPLRPLYPLGEGHAAQNNRCAEIHIIAMPLIHSLK